MSSSKSQLPLNVTDSVAPSRHRSSRFAFNLAYVLIWGLAVLSCIGAYGLDNSSQWLLTAQLSVLGALGVGAAVVCTAERLSRSGRLAVLCYPVLYLWAVLCYALLDERFIIRTTGEAYSGSTISAPLAAVVLFLLLPDTIGHRFIPCLLAGVTGLVLLGAFQIAGVRANSGLAEVSMVLVAVFFLCQRCYHRSRLRHSSLHSGTILPVTTKLESEAETWGLVDETNVNPDTERVLRKLHEAHRLLASLAKVPAAKDTVKSAMCLVQEAGRDLTSLNSAKEGGSAGLVGKAVESEYRMYLEERFLPVKSQASHPIAHPIQYGGQELIPMLSQLEKNWNFDMFFLAQVSGFRALEVTGEYCMRKYTLDTNLQLSEARVLRFLQEMERKYKPNPYHNSTHAADVLNSLLFLYKQSDIFKELTELELFGSIVAALGHDVGHPAFSNRYLMNTRSQFAMMCKC